MGPAAPAAERGKPLALRGRLNIMHFPAFTDRSRGVAAFRLLRHRRNEPAAFLYAFDLLELNGAELRREPIEVRKATLASILRKSRPGVRLNEHMEHPEGAVVFQHACKMGLEGIVSKRLGSRYRSGRSPDWLKFKNPEAPAVKREAEKDWAS